MIEINHIVKRFGDNFALNDISFSVGEGEIVGFLGPNGAGKSTTINILTGYLSATSGSAKINGIDILDDPIEAKKLIGYLPEQPPLYLDMTVKEYLDFVYDLKKCRLDRKSHIAEICEIVKIGDVYSRLIAHLSKGYRQRVGIAQALIGNPKVLIFDEPTVGLDPAQIIEIRNLVKNLGRKHTVILSTHILPEVTAICDRVVIINKGKIVADGTAESIREKVAGKSKLKAKICGPQSAVLGELKAIDGVLSVRVDGEKSDDATTYIIESANDADIRKPLFNMLSKHDFALVGLEDVEASLEDIFITLVEKNGGAVR